MTSATAVLKQCKSRSRREVKEYLLQRLIDDDLYAFRFNALRNPLKIDEARKLSDPLHANQAINARHFGLSGEDSVGNKSLRVRFCFNDSGDNIVGAN